MDGTQNYLIKTLQPDYSCGRSLSHKLVTAKYLATRYLENFRSVKGVDVQEFQNKFIGNYLLMLVSQRLIGQNLRPWQL